jgi:hypothetical protein
MALTKGEKLLQDFDEDARSWGWTEDQGVGYAVEISRSSYLTSKNKLIEYIKLLERRKK